MNKTLRPRVSPGIIKVLISALSVSLCLIIAFSLSCTDSFAGTSNYNKAKALAISAIEQQNTGEINMSSTGITVSELKSLWTDLHTNYPNYFWLSNYYATYNKSTNRVAGVTFRYGNYTRSDIQKYETKIKEILSHINPEMTDFQKALTLHDYLVSNVFYADNSYKSSAVSFGPIVGGYGSCNGYATAYLDLLKRAGVDSKYVKGYAGNGEIHAWNYVKIDGKWYHVDVTWDDPQPDTPTKVTHEYFLLSDSAIKNKSHYGWEAAVSCSSSYYDNFSLFRNSIGKIICDGSAAMYYLSGSGDNKDSTIHLIKRETGADKRTKDTVVASAKDYWKVWGANQYYPNTYYTALDKYGSYLYFNDSTHIYAYNLLDGKTKTYYTYSGQGYIYGLMVQNGTLIILVKKDNKETGSLYSMTVPADRLNPFYDVAYSSYYCPAVRWGFSNNITSGTTQTQFSPNLSCSRAQAVTFLWRAAGSPRPQGGGVKFKDVKSNAYYYTAVQWAVQNGITSGTSATTFSPDLNCTRGQIVTLLYRLKGSSNGSSGMPFYDVKYGDYFYNAVSWALNKKITTGITSTSFAPNANCSRGQIITFLYRAYC